MITRAASCYHTIAQNTFPDDFTVALFTIFVFFLGNFTLRRSLLLPNPLFPFFSCGFSRTKHVFKCFGNYSLPFTRHHVYARRNFSLSQGQSPKIIFFTIQIQFPGEIFHLTENSVRQSFVITRVGRKTAWSSTCS